MAHRPLVVAHRGASRAARENTLEAFRLAAAAGADGVELDVRRTADSVLVVHHDPVVDGVGPCAGVPFATLRGTRPDVPTLAEALTACAGLLVNVEVKCLPWEPDADPAHEVIRAAVDLAHDHDGGVIVSSFDLGALDTVRTHAPAVATAYLAHGVDPRVAARLARGRGHPWLHPDRASVLPDPGVVAACTSIGVRLDVWTVDDPGEMRVLAAAGVDAIITNVPDVARAALE